MIYDEGAYICNHCKHKEYKMIEDIIFPQCCEGSHFFNYEVGGFDPIEGLCPHYEWNEMDEVEE